MCTNVCVHLDKSNPGYYIYYDIFFICIYIYIYCSKPLGVVQCLYFCSKLPSSGTVVVVVVNFIKHQNRAITGERVAARAAPSYQYAMVLVIIT